MVSRLKFTIPFSTYTKWLINPQIAHKLDFWKPLKFINFI